MFAQLKKFNYICCVNNTVKPKIVKMRVDAREILFIRQNAPVGMIRTLATNIEWDYQKVRNELHTLKEEYPDAIVIEARRLLEANTGLVYKPETAA